MALNDNSFVDQRRLRQGCCHHLQRRNGLAGGWMMALAWAMCLFVSLLRGLAATKVNITIAGFFNPFDEAGQPDYDQIQHIAAFQKAISDFNSMTPYFHFQYVIKSGFGYSGAAAAALQVVATRAIPAAVSALPTTETSAAHQVFGDFGIVMSHSVSADPMFSDGLKYPYKVQTVPLTIEEGRINQYILCAFRAERIIVFSSNDADNLKTTKELSSGTYCPINNVATYTFDPTTTDFTDIITNAMTTQVTIFVLFMGFKNAANLLEQAYDLGLLHEGTQLLTSSSLLDPEIFNYFSPGADIPSIMKGLIGVEYFPNYHFNNTDSYAYGRQFVASYRNMLSTLNNCDQVDVAGRYFLYPTGTRTGSCYGIDYSSFDHTGKDMNPYLGQTYDATFAICYGIALTLGAGQSLTGDNLMASIIQRGMFHGASGNIIFNAGDSTGYNKGARQFGLVYKAKNFNGAAFLQNPNQSFALVANWGSDQNPQLPCPLCLPVVLNTKYNIPTNGYPPYTANSAPSVIKIGAYFSPFDENGNFDRAQAENLAAFLMAVREVNDKTDSMHNDILPSSTVVVAFRTGQGFVGGVSAAQDLNDAFYYTGVLGAVIGMPNTETTAACQMLTNFEIPQVSSMVSDSDLGDGNRYPYEIQIAPVDSFQGIVYSSLICDHFKYRKISVFVVNNYVGSDFYYQLSECDFDVLDYESLDSSSTDFSKNIASASVSGARVFVLCVPTKIAALLLKQGYDKSLFGLETQIFVTSDILSPSLFSYFPDPTEIPSIMRGVITIEPWHNYALSQRAKGQEFVQRWRKQAYTNSSLVNGVHKCDNTLDDSGSSYYYRNPLGTSCAGLNFSSYQEDGSDINPYAAYTYDATISLLTGIHSLIKYGLPIDASNVALAIAQNYSQEGITGEIEIKSFQSDTQTKHTEYYGGGLRYRGFTYLVKNFNAERYSQHSSSVAESFALVGIWNDTGYFGCSQVPSLECSEISYNSKVNVPVSESRPDVIVTLTPIESIILYILGAITFVLVIIFTIVFNKYSGSKLVKASQPVMLFATLVGEAFAGLRVLNAGLAITDATCITGLWFAHLAFAFVFGSLFIKTWRVHKIVNNPTLKRVRITTKDVIRMMAAIVVSMVAYLIVLTIVAEPHKSFIASYSNNQTTKNVICAFTYPQMHTALMIFEAVALVYGARLCWAVKNVPDAVNESKHIASAVSFIVLVAALVFPIVFLIQLPSPIKIVIASIGFAVASYFTLIVLFYPKSHALFSGKDIDENLKVAKKSSPVRKYSKGSVIGVESVGGDSVGAIVSSTEALRGASADERVRICAEQVAHWQALMLKVGDAGYSSSNSRSRSGNASAVQSQLDQSAEIVVESAKL